MMIIFSIVLAVFSHVGFCADISESFKKARESLDRHYYDTGPNECTVTKILSQNGLYLGCRLSDSGTTRQTLSPDKVKESECRRFRFNFCEFQEEAFLPPCSSNKIIGTDLAHEQCYEEVALTPKAAWRLYKYSCLNNKKECQRLKLGTNLETNEQKE